MITYSNKLDALVPNVVIPGRAIYVSSLVGRGTSAGSKLDPLDTLTNGLALCVSGRGDTVYLMPGHAEAITGAGTVTCNKTQVSIVGLGKGLLRPTFNFTTSTAATWLVTAADVSVENVYFTMGIDGVIMPFNIQGSGFTMKNCEVYFAKNDYVALKVMSVTTAAGTNLTLVDNHWRGDATANCVAALTILGGSCIKIKNNIIRGNFTVTAGAIVGTGTLATDVTIDGNILENKTAVANKAIVLLTGTTGRIVNNKMLTATATTVFPVTTDGCVCTGNKWSTITSFAIVGGFIDC